MRGIKLAIVIFALGVSGAFLTGVGFVDQANVDPGPSLETERSAVEDDVAGDQNVSNVGGDPAFFGINVRTSGVIGTLFRLYGAAEGMARTANIPQELAAGLGSMVLVFGGGMFLIQWLRGSRFED